MNPRRHFSPLLIALVFGSATGMALAATPKHKPPESDIAAIEARRGLAEHAESLAKVDTPEALSDASLPRPFNPPGFGQDSRPVAVETVATPGPVKSFGDRELLRALASKIMPGGTFSLGSQSLLGFGKKNLRAGDHLTVNYEGQEYILELVSFDRTNFTLRLNHEEITRPIKPGKNP